MINHYQLFDGDDGNDDGDDDNDDDIPFTPSSSFDIYFRWRFSLNKGKFCNTLFFFAKLHFSYFLIDYKSLGYFYVYNYNMIVMMTITIVIISMMMRRRMMVMMIIMMMIMWWYWLVLIMNHYQLLLLMSIIMNSDYQSSINYY